MTDQTDALFGTEGHANEIQAQRNELAAITAELRGREEVAFDTELDTATAEVLATQLVSTKDQNDAQLSYALHVLRTDKAYLNAGYDSFQEYVENKLRFSVAKANNLATRWEHFVALGLSTNVLTGTNPVSWGKFAELIPGVKAGVIDDQSIDVWLPLTRTDGHLSLNNTGIAKFVKAEIAALDQEEDPDQPKDFTIKVTADDRANILQYIDTIEQGTGMLGAGEVVRSALEAKVTDIASNSEDIRRTFGIVKLIEMAQNMAPGIQLIAIASAESGYNPENLGVVPYTSLYQNGDEPGSVVLATSAEEAAQALGSENIVEIPLAVAGAPQEAVEEPQPTEGEFSEWEEFDHSA